MQHRILIVQWRIYKGAPPYWKANYRFWKLRYAAAATPPPPRTEKISNSAPPLMVFPGSATESGTICENGSIVELFSKNGTLKQAIIWTWKWLHCRAFSATLYSFTEDLSFVIQLVFRVCEIMIRSSWMIKREISNTDSKICRKTERKCPSTPSYHDNYVLLALLVNSY